MCRGASLDVLKEAYDAYSERIRSPIVGSIFFSFVAINWKPLWFLVFEEASARRKFEYFDGATNFLSLYFGPIFLGISIALALPWFQFVWARLVSRPIRMLKSYQAEEASRLRIESFERKTAEEEALRKHEEAVADRTIGAAKRQKEAGDVGGEALAEELSEAVKTSNAQRQITEEELLESLGSVDLLVLGLIREHQTIVSEKSELLIYYDDYCAIVENPTKERMFVDMRDSLDFLEGKGAIRTAQFPFEDNKLRYGGRTKKYVITALGYRVHDLMIADATE